MVAWIQALKSYWRGRLDTVDLLVLTSLKQVLFILKILFTLFKKQATLIRRSTVLSLPPHPLIQGMFCNSFRVKNDNDSISTETKQYAQIWNPQNFKNCLAHIWLNFKIIKFSLNFTKTKLAETFPSVAHFSYKFCFKIEELNKKDTTSWDQCHKTFYRGNLLPMYGNAIFLCFITLAPGANAF